MNKLAAVRMQNLQAVITGVSDALDPDHVLHVLDASARDDGDVNVGDVRQALKNIFGFFRKCRQVGMWSDWCQGSVVVEQ